MEASAVILWPERLGTLLEDGEFVLSATHQ
jgi:hypothetical protein